MGQAAHLLAHLSDFEPRRGSSRSTMGPDELRARLELWLAPSSQKKEQPTDFFMQKAIR